MYHSKYRKTAAELLDVEDKKVVVIGCVTSGHDISAVLITPDAKEMMMAQRCPVYSISGKGWQSPVLSLWNIEGQSIEEADWVRKAIPLMIFRTMSIIMIQAMAENDKIVYDGFKKAGFEIEQAHNGSSLADCQLIDGGQHPIDPGTNRMIVDGKTEIQRC